MQCMHDQQGCGSLIKRRQQNLLVCFFVFFFCICLFLFLSLCLCFLFVFIRSPFYFLISVYSCLFLSPFLNSFCRLYFYRFSCFIFVSISVSCCLLSLSVCFPFFFFYSLFCLFLSPPVSSLSLSVSFLLSLFLSPFRCMFGSICIYFCILSIYFCITLYLFLSPFTPFLPPLYIFFSALYIFFSALYIFLSALYPLLSALYLFLSALYIFLSALYVSLSVIPLLSIFFSLFFLLTSHMTSSRRRSLFSRASRSRRSNQNMHASYLHAESPIHACNNACKMHAK